MDMVGPLVGPFADVAPSGSGGGAPSDGSDFAIGDLFFKVEPNDKNPYQRATAQFRKDQYDTGQNAGDQSLTGWWTRGQFAFHKGAGITYYEVREGDTVLNRFTDGDGVDPFDPGRVVCQTGWTGPIAGATYTQSASVGSYLLMLDDGTLRYSSGPSLASTYTADGGSTVLALAVSPVLAYAALSNGKITSLDPSTGTETILYTGLTTTIRGLWYVKSRLVVSDSDGKWYQLAVNPDTPPNAVATADLIFTGADWAADSVVTDTPGPILIGNANRIFALTLDGTGTIPTLSAPVQVGELPPGEVVDAICHHLGFVVLVTGAGVRVAVLSESGQVTYGPVLIERALSAYSFDRTQIARYGTRVAVIIDSRAYEIDLSEQVGQGLEFGYVGRGTPGGEASTMGLATFRYDTLIIWKDDSLWYSEPTDALLEGSLTTGYHRFATLEPKRFDSVRVHASGTKGTITVFKVDSNGAETSLYVMDVSVSHVEEIPFRFSSSEEMVAVKFVLTPDPDDPDVSPVLLGYQIRALPEPQRQRIIRVPLMMKDVERRQPARSSGRTGSAWERLRALEDMENSGAIVTFTDYRTGESGRAYVEAVEFSNITPPSNQSTGFGGTAFVTLRKL